MIDREAQDIARQLRALRQRRRRLAALPPAEAKREARRFLFAAGIITRSGRLAAWCRGQP